MALKGYVTIDHLWIDGIKRAVTAESYRSTLDWFNENQDADGPAEPLPITFVEEDGSLNERLVDSSKISF